mmetsp:Transcript_6193/g.17278  ORF Transcript_6193/g.17278 Transcript_6193/m.17278 type:complete len:453 (+) Transcript_6193:666-2024(+)
MASLALQLPLQRKHDVWRDAQRHGSRGRRRPHEGARRERAPRDAHGGRVSLQRRHVHRALRGLPGRAHGRRESQRRRAHRVLPAAGLGRRRRWHRRGSGMRHRHQLYPARRHVRDHHHHHRRLRRLPRCRGHRPARVWRHRRRHGRLPHEPRRQGAILAGRGAHAARVLGDRGLRRQHRHLLRLGAHHEREELLHAGDPGVGLGLALLPIHHAALRARRDADHVLVPALSHGLWAQLQAGRRPVLRGAARRRGAHPGAHRRGGGRHRRQDQGSHRVPHVRHRAAHADDQRHRHGARAQGAGADQGSGRAQEAPAASSAADRGHLRAQDRGDAGERPLPAELGVEHRVPVPPRALARGVPRAQAQDREQAQAHAAPPARPLEALREEVRQGEEGPEAEARQARHGGVKGGVQEAQRRRAPLELARAAEPVGLRHVSARRGERHRLGHVADCKR